MIAVGPLGELMPDAAVSSSTPGPACVGSPLTPTSGCSPLSPALPQLGPDTTGHPSQSSQIETSACSSAGQGAPVAANDTRLEPRISGATADHVAPMGTDTSALASENSSLTTPFWMETHGGMHAAGHPAVAEATWVDPYISTGISAVGHLGAGEPSRSERNAILSRGTGWAASDNVPVLTHPGQAGAAVFPAYASPWASGLVRPQAWIDGHARHEAALTQNQYFENLASDRLGGSQQGGQRYDAAGWPTTLLPACMANHNIPGRPPSGPREVLSSSDSAFRSRQGPERSAKFDVVMLGIC